MSDWTRTARTADGHAIEWVDNAFASGMTPGLEFRAAIVCSGCEQEIDAQSLSIEAGVPMPSPEWYAKRDVEMRERVAAHRCEAER